jgi:AbrB family looped-hinge helix DNA binding protein
MNTVIDRFGRVVIPKEARDDLGLEPGTVLEVRESSEGLLLVPARRSGGLRHKDGVLVFDGQAEDDLRDAVRRHRRDRLRHAGRRRS